jgi:hypothetical protein
MEERALIQKDRESREESAKHQRDLEEKARLIERLKNELQERDDIIRELRTGVLIQLEQEKDGIQCY